MGPLQYMLYSVSFTNFVAFDGLLQQEEHGENFTRGFDGGRAEDHVWTTVGVLSGHVLFDEFVYLERFCG